jgi:hypothetical protein
LVSASNWLTKFYREYQIPVTHIFTDDVERATHVARMVNTHRIGRTS